MAHRALALLLLLLTPSLAWAQASIEMLTPVNDGTDATTYTFNGVPIGAAAADRYIAIFVTGRRFGSSCSVSSATIAGVAATEHATNATDVTGGNCGTVTLIYNPALMPTGTTTTVTVTFASAMARASLTVLRLTGINRITPASVIASLVSDPTATMTVYAMSVGAAVSATHDANTTNATWTGLTEQFDQVVEVGGGTRHSGAVLNPSTAQIGFTATADWDVTSGTHNTTGLFVSWGRAGPVSSTPTHYVTPAGSGSPSICAEDDPCSLTRAFALAGLSAMPPGSYVSIAAGTYNQPGITTTNGGLAGLPIRMVGQGVTSTYITGERTSFPASAWTRTTDGTACGGLCTYTYQASHSAYFISMFGQNWTASTWSAITVDDRAPPFSSGSGRAYDLDEPLRYSTRTSITEVELQHCTYYYNTTSDILYMHPCREATPTNGDAYYGGADSEGTIIYSGGGDYLTLENVAFWHTTDKAIHVQQTATGTEFLDIRSNGGAMWFQGSGTNVERMFVKEVVNQGPVPNAACYGGIYGSGVSARSCFNQNTTGGEYAVLIGEDGTAGGNQTFDYLHMERGWNGYISFGNPYINHASCWGFANHCGQFQGTGGTLTNGTFSNSQDVLYDEGRDFNQTTITHNLFDGGVLFWCSRDGLDQGAVCPTSWSYRSNIHRSWTSDTITEPFLSPPMDCDVIIEFGSSSTIYRRTPVTGVPGADLNYDTLAEIQANTPYEDNGREYLSTAWTDGSIFDDHTSRENYPLDFSLTAGGAALLTTCGTVAGPDTLAQDAEPIAPTAAILRFRFTRR